MKRYKKFLLFFLVILVSPKITFAYLDPGIFTYIMQIIIAGITGIVFITRDFLHKITKLFFRITKFLSRIFLRRD